MFQRFIKLCAARNGQLLNLSNLAEACGVSHVTVRSWLGVLEASYIIILLQPFFENFGKRLVKTPKLYFYDTGLVSTLLNIQDEERLALHPMRGALFETYVLSELLKTRFNKGLNNNVYFWRDNVGNEIDFMIDCGQKIIGIEAKATQTIHPEMLQRLQKWQKLQTKSQMDLQFLYGGNESYSRSNILIKSWQDINMLY